MPIPAILAGLVAAAVGIGAQMDAKETNERAQQIANEAQKWYNDTKQSLEAAQSITEQSLVKLGTSKKQVLESSIAQFLTAYERIKNIEFSESVGLDEIKNFAIEKQDAIHLREMANIYQSTFSSGAAGAATGAVIALAASGSLPIVTSVLSTAGTALMAGEIGAAAGLAGSALSFGAAMTPLAAIAAPAVLFSGISASMKADENLEKAETMYAEAEAAVEKMETAKVLCNGIAQRADMFDDLLGELNEMFAYCTALLDGVTRKKMGRLKNKTVDARTFSESELKLVAVTRSLAGAVKAVIDTPILTPEGSLSSEAETMYESTSDKLSAFAEAVDEVRQVNYHCKAKAAMSPDTKRGSGNIRNALSLVLGIVVGSFLQGIFVTDSLAPGAIGFVFVALLMMQNKPTNKAFSFFAKVCRVIFLAVFVLAFWNVCAEIVLWNHYILACLISGTIFFILFGIFLPSKNGGTNNLKRNLVRIFGCLSFFAAGILVYAFLSKFLSLSHLLSAVIATLLYAFFAYIIVAIADD